VTFQDILSQTLRGASGPQGGRGGVNGEQIGLGVLVSGIDTIQSQGTLQSTGKSTDMAIQGDGYFVMSDGKQSMFTRDGAFDLASTARSPARAAVYTCSAGRPTRSPASSTPPFRRPMSPCRSARA